MLAISGCIMRARSRAVLVLAEVVVSVLLHFCSADRDEGGRACRFVEQLQDVHCSGLEAVLVPRGREVRDADLDVRSARVERCREVCCELRSCQMYMVKTLASSPSELAAFLQGDRIECWVGRHSEVRCESGTDSAAGLGWVGERLKTSSAFADEYIDLLLRTVTGANLDTLSAHPEPRALSAEGDASAGGSTRMHSAFDPMMRLHGADWPIAGLTTAGMLHLASVHDALVQSDAEGVRGDFVEVGAGRAGAAVFAAGVIRRRSLNRRVFACDYFGIQGAASGQAAVDLNSADEAKVYKR